MDASWDIENAVIHGCVDFHVCHDPAVDQDNGGAPFILHCELLELVCAMGVEAKIGSGLSIVSRKREEGFDISLARHRHVAHENFHGRVVQLNFAGKGGAVTRSALAVKADRYCRRFFAACKKEAWDHSRHEDQQNAECFHENRQAHNERRELIQIDRICNSAISCLRIVP